MKPSEDKEDKRIGSEIIADAIVEISAMMRRIQQTRLSRKALVALIHDHSKISKKTIEIVLNNLTNLEVLWLTPAKKK